MERVVARLAALFPFQERESALVFAELGLEGGSGRADLAVLDRLWWGFEVKTEGDTLKRLRRQQEIYSRIFDRCLLVAAPKHIDKAAAILPPYWGVAAIEDPGFRLLRSPGHNPDVDPLSLARLLWKPELCSLLYDVSPRKYKHALCVEAAARYPVRRLRSIIKGYMRGRFTIRDGNWVESLAV